MKKIAALILLVSTSFLSYGQQTDSLLIKGKLLWDRNGIIDFPKSIKIVDAKDPANSRVIKVNEKTGDFSISAINGRYFLRPSKSYHWQGEDIVRIDSEKSEKQFKANIDTSKNGVIFTLRTIEKPNLIPDIGILHDPKKKLGKNIDDFMLAYMNYYQVPGASLAVIKKGEIIYENVYGIKNSRTNEAIDSETLFEAGSITKTVFSFIVMRLFEKGLIDLDKPLYQYLGFEDIEHDDRYKLITARIVLSHQTGFPNWAKGKFDLKFKPGTQFGYSGEAFEYLKRVLEKITRKSISTLIKEEFIIPLELEHIYFSGNEFQAELFSNGHKDEIPLTKRNIKAPMMAFSMVTKADAFAKYAIALRNKKGLQKETYDQLFKIHSTRNDGTHWSLGFRIEDTKFGKTYGHSGATSGFICNYVYYDQLDVGFVVLTNSRMGGWLSLPLLNQLLITGKNTVQN